MMGYNYTVNSLTEEEYRQWLEHTFKPIFESNEAMGGGIPARELLSRFQYQGFGLPQDRRKDLILYLDANRDDRITFEVSKIFNKKEFSKLRNFARLWCINALLTWHHLNDLE